MNLDKEQLINRYIPAMEHNDADAIAEILALAIDDIALASMTDEVNQANAEALAID